MADSHLTTLGALLTNLVVSSDNDGLWTVILWLCEHRIPRTRPTWNVTNSHRAEIQFAGNARLEDNGGFFLLPYWMRRYTKALA